MSIVAATQRARRPAAAGTYDRAFYTGMAVAMALTVFVGFAPSYYLRAVFGSPTPSGATELSSVLHLHGALFTGWVVLFLVQTSLIATRRVAVHRRLGIATATLAVVMVVVGVLTAIKAAARGAAPPGVDPLAFLVIPLADITLFALFVAAAIWQRKNRETHKRLMLLAYICLLFAAVARLPGILPLGPPGFFGVTLLFLVVALIYDLATRRRVHRVYVWGGALLVLSLPGRLLISGTEAWRAFAEMLVR